MNPIRHPLTLGLAAAVSVALPASSAPSGPETQVWIDVATHHQAGMPDMGSMMGPRVMPGMGMMRILVYPNLIPAGQVSLRVTNRGALSHELVVLPLAPGQLSGHRLSGPDSRVDESGSLGEVSRTCGPDKGDEQSPDDGIAPHDSGWTTLALAPGRYELICNIAGHYVAGMSAELDVIGAAK